MADTESESDVERDGSGRFPAGSVRGWGLSWWLAEQNVDAESFVERPTTERMRLVHNYFDAVADGWEPDAPPSTWTGPHHWAEPS